VAAARQKHLPIASGGTGHAYQHNRTATSIGSKVASAAFGEDYDDYGEHTARLILDVW